MRLDGFLWVVTYFGYSLFLARIDAGKSPERSEFPPDFAFGVSTSAYQVEGAVKEGGRGPSIWDTYTHDFPEKVDDRSNGDIAADSYHLYKEDVRMIREVGLNAYRFSLSWSRILPRGNLRGVNKEGIKYYNNLINELIHQGIKPFVTLFHWDAPQALEDEYGGFLSSKIVDDFLDYCDICFREFGDRVKYWITINEPMTFSTKGYDHGNNAPGRCSTDVKRCGEGNSSTEPYQVAHNLLLAHATAVKLYRNQYKEEQNGMIGIAPSCDWFMPLTNSTDDEEAALRELDFRLGWILDPLTRGDYPPIMREYIGERLPRFTKEESEILRGSYDFLGINYYTAQYAAHIPYVGPSVPKSQSQDSRVSLSVVRNGIPIGPKAASSWLYVYPEGIKELLLHVKKKYNDPIIYITENGVDEHDMKMDPFLQCLNDTMRVDYHRQHISFLLEALREGVKLKGYFMWSLMDNFEWENGYTVRFGIYYVDFMDNAKRYPKSSAHWIAGFLGGGILNPTPILQYSRRELKDLSDHTIFL
ncbi:beta-glucosidase 24 [Amborella trichopoda]|uniref:beta-glucosidase 24 n=1 Tax=Amborella trichopoda TaxID=13333 RepID=UPI0005D32C80|nr:beta-glucosidase 24 [Amborella trichopoda]|eukprot:XP_011624566.1 beta-glucosidase 24 [Amborella trichopoda]